MPAGSKFPNVSLFSKSQAGEWDFDSFLRGKVLIAAVSAGIVLPASLINDSSMASAKLSTTSSGTASVLAAQGATTATRVVGFSVCYLGSLVREIELRFGATAFWYGALGPRSAFNWNFVNHSQKSANNKAVNLHVNAAGTVISTVYWKKA